MREENNVSGIARSKSTKKLPDNRVPFKCNQERNVFIKQEVKNLIKKEMKIYLTGVKLQKDLQTHKKNYIVIDVPTPIERVTRYRSKQLEQSERNQGLFKEKYEKKAEKVHHNILQSRMDKIAKSSSKFQRMQKVRENFENLQKANFQKIEDLRASFCGKSKFRVNDSRNFHATFNVGDRIKTAQEINRRKQELQINNFLSKMKVLEDRCLQKELQTLNKKALTSKNSPRCNISQRIAKQGDLMEKWEKDHQNKINRFEKNREGIIESKNKDLMERTLRQSMTLQSVFERKSINNENLALERIKSLEKKIQKINQAPRRQSNNIVFSKRNREINRFNSCKDEQKLEHNLKMKNLFHIIEKLKQLNNSEKLNQEEIQTLLQQDDDYIRNLNSSDSQFTEISSFLNNTKEKYFQKKEKQEEERIKLKNKKNAHRML